MSAEVIDVEIGFRMDRLRSGLKSASDLADRFQSSIAKRMEAIKGPEIKPTAGATSGGTGGPPGAADVPNQAEQLAGAIIPLAAGIQQSIARATAPLNGFASRFSAQFDKVGGTIIALARRIDQQLKFPAFERGMERLRAFVQSKFRSMADDPRQWAQTVDRALAGAQWVAKVKNAVSQIGDITRKGIGEMGRIKAPSVNFSSSTTTINNMKAATDRAAGSMRNFGVQVAAALGIFGLVYKSVQFLKDGIKSATDLGETMAKTGEVFKDHTATVTAQAEKMAAAYGLPKGALLDAASAFGLMGKAAGKSGPRLASFANEMTALSADVMSFYNIPFDEAQQKLRAGLAGEAEPLRALGVNLDEASVKTEAFRLGIAKAGTELTAQQKITARQSLITKGLATASGDLARTQGSAANQFRKLTGSVANMATEIGTALMPAVNTAISGLNSAFGGVGKFFESNRGMIEGFSARIAGAFDAIGAHFNNILPQIRDIGSTIAGGFASITGSVGSALPSFESFSNAYKATLATINLGIGQAIAAVQAIPETFAACFGEGTLSGIGNLASTIKETLVGAIDTIGFAIRNAGDIFSIARLQIGQQIGYLIDSIGLIPTNLGRIAGFVKGNWFDLVTAPFKGITRLLAELGKSFWEFLKKPSKGFQFDFDGLLKDFKAAAAKLPEMARPELAKIDDQVNQHLANVAKTEEKYRATIAQGYKAPAARTAEATNGAAQGAGPRGVVDANAGESPSVKALNEIAKFAEDLREKTRTPLEEFREQLGKIKDSYGKGLIDEKTALRGVAQARNKLDGKPEYAKASEVGSLDARSALLAAMGARPTKDDLSKDTRQIAKQGGETVGILTRIERALAESRRVEYSIG